MNLANAADIAHAAEAVNAAATAQASEAVNAAATAQASEAVNAAATARAAEAVNAAAIARASETMKPSETAQAAETASVLLPPSFQAVGIDIVDVPRFAEMLLRRPGLRARLFTEAELAYADRSARQAAARLAARFAAKEAVLKVFGIGLGACRFADVEVVRHPSGRPELSFGPTAQRRCEQAGLFAWQLSLSHTAATAVAWVSALRPLRFAAAPDGDAVAAAARERGEQAQRAIGVSAKRLATPRCLPDASAAQDALGDAAAPKLPTAVRCPKAVG